MPKELTWDDPEDIGILLSEKHPETDPLAVRFTDLHRLVIELPSSRMTPGSRMRGSWKPYRWHGTRSFWTVRRLNSQPQRLSRSPIADFAARLKSCPSPTTLLRKLDHFVDSSSL